MMRRAQNKMRTAWCLCIGSGNVVHMMSRCGWVQWHCGLTDSWNWFLWIKLLILEILAAQKVFLLCLSPLPIATCTFLLHLQVFCPMVSNSFCCGLVLHSVYFLFNRGTYYFQKMLSYLVFLPICYRDDCTINVPGLCISLFLIY